jgi:hypothetical protein
MAINLLIRKIVQPNPIFSIIKRILTQTNPLKRNCHGHEPVFNSKQACPYLHSLRSLAQMGNARMHWKHLVGHKDSAAQAAATRNTACLR